MAPVFDIPSPCVQRFRYQINSQNRERMIPMTIIAPGAPSSPSPCWAWRSRSPRPLRLG